MKKRVLSALVATAVVGVTTALSVMKWLKW